MRDDPKLLDSNSIQVFFLAHTIDTYIMLPKKRMHHERLTLRWIFLAGSQWRREPIAGMVLAAAARGAKQQQAMEEA